MKTFFELFIISLKQVNVLCPKEEKAKIFAGKGI